MREMRQSFRKHSKSGLVYLTVPALARYKSVRHAFTTRPGGVSSGVFAELNLGIFTADQPEHIIENRRRVCEVLHIPPDCLVGARQVHGDRIHCVTRADKGRGAADRESAISDTDALITDEPQLALLTFFADCVPLLLFDPAKKVIALAHAGWKGTVAKIGAQTAQVMQERYGSRPGDILAVVGPSIGPCHYQVDTPVIQKIREAYPADWQHLLSGFTGDGHADLNLWEANARSLTGAGIARQNITVMSVCTYCHQDLLFSHRAGMAGRQAAIFMLTGK